MKNVSGQLCVHRASNALPRIFVLLFACLLSSPTVQADDWELSANMSYESRYVSWGVEDLDEGGLYSVGFDAAKDGFFLAVWLADAGQEDFQETNLTFGYEWLLADDLGAEVAVIRVDGFEDGEHVEEYEVEAFLAYELADWVAGLTYLYLTEGDADALAFTLEGVYEVGGFGITPAIELIYNFDYVEVDGLDLENSLSSAQLHLGVSRQLSEALELEASLTHVIALNSLRDQYRSLTWAGIAFTAHF